VPGESEANYRALYQRVRGSIEPADLIEELWVRDITDLFWETLRLRRFKAKLMTAAAYQGVGGLLAVLKPTGSTTFSTSAVLLGKWARKEPAALEEVAGILAAAGLDDETISAKTLSIKLDTFDRIDRMIMQTELRRNAALREIDRRRGAAAARLRNAIQDVTDVEIEEVPLADMAGSS